jgi:hypothetical protein
MPPPPQVWPMGQVPQSSWLPQPSPAGPHEIACWAQLFAVHGAVPQTPDFPPPPQVSPTLQLPHWITLPQPSPAGPHEMP